MGAIHGRLLTAWAAAGVAGPLIVNGFLDARGEPGALVAADYRPALLTMVGLLVVGFLAHLAVKQVDGKWHEPSDSHPAEPTAAEASTEGLADEAHGVSPLLVVAWLVVGLPLAYGIYETVVKAADLFS